MFAPLNEERSAIAQRDMETPPRDSDRPSRGCAANSLLRLQRLYGNRYVQRLLMLDRKEAENNEVSPPVEAAIESGRGGGQALDRTIRSQMEPAFGADFSGVRIHTGPESDSLNREVNAVAFTTGQDIFFREGAYNPASSDGRELLAHELTHVVQQTGNHAIQTKLVLGAPDDQYEREADQVARTVVNAINNGSTQNEVASEAGASVQRACACGGVAGPDGECEECKKKEEVVQRRGSGTAQNWRANGSENAGLLQRQTPANPVPPVPTPPLQNGNITLSGTAQLIKDPDTALTGPIPLKKDDEVSLSADKVQRDPQTGVFHGRIRMTINANWSFAPATPVIKTVLKQRTGQGVLVIDAPFRLQSLNAKNEEDTGIKAQQARVIRQESSGEGASLDPQPAVTPDVDDTGFSITVAPRVTYQEQTAVAGQLGVDASSLLLQLLDLFSPVKIPDVLKKLLEALGLQAQAQIQNQSTNTQAFGASFTARLPMTKPAPKDYECDRTNPDYKQPDAAFGPFVIASDRFIDENGQRFAIKNWYFGLDPIIRKDLELGKGIIRITGRASRTGTQTFNLELAKKRAKKVLDIIKDFAGSDAHLNSFALGEFGAQTPDEKEDANERRVEVVITGKVPPEDVASLTGDNCSGHIGQSSTTGPTGPVTNPEDVTAPAPTASSAGQQPEGVTPGVTTLAAPGVAPPTGVPAPETAGAAPSGVAGAAASAGEPLAAVGTAVEEGEQPAGGGGLEGQGATTEEETAQGAAV